MKPTMSKDGKRRLNIAVKFRVDAYKLAVHFTSAHMVEAGEHEPEAFANWAMTKFKSLKSFTDVFKTSIERDGGEVPYYRVGDERAGDHAEKLAERLKNKFGLD